ncbi:MAG: M20 family metallopeptidase [Clostridia bacterium]|nr:M20 family metallopeptidase [Clostridia bacterium]
MKNYLDEAVKAISESIKFDSSLSEAKPDMPFGKGAADCLAHFLSLAESLGFETHNYDNYVGEAIFGDGEEEFAILAHLDVVPAGGGWDKPPFGGIVENGRIWGRGAMDDKGPAIASLFALKKLKDEGFTPKKKIKLIVGLNEECGWKCIEHYNKVAHMPDTGFSPDANFPVIYAEKGILHIRADFPVEKNLFSSLTGGEHVNMVCDRCEATPLSPVDTEKAKSLSINVENDRLVSKGKSAHGSTPEEGVNAILPMLEYFGLQRVIDCLFNDIYGLKTLKDETGNLTLSPDVISYKDGVLSVLVDIRYPATLPLSSVTEKLDKFGVKYETVSYQKPLFQDKNNELVKTLQKVYDDYTGKKHEPIAIGGGTYARALKCGVAFGPEIEGEEVTIHQANEYITIDRVKLMLEVYAEAVKRLTK